ncbi:MAG: hypothetical protein OXQ94_06905 [Gemmatimonadota bacterium]|nr:hypothetical protein [Gemmatimonadota bacterium]
MPRVLARCGLARALPGWAVRRAPGLELEDGLVEWSGAGVRDTLITSTMPARRFCTLTGGEAPL